MKRFFEDDETALKVVASPLLDLAPLKATPSGFCLFIYVFISATLHPALHSVTESVHQGHTQQLGHTGVYKYPRVYSLCRSTSSAWLMHVPRV